jgi:hypothetical protein
MNASYVWDLQYSACEQTTERSGNYVWREGRRSYFFQIAGPSVRKAMDLFELTRRADKVEREAED